MPWRPGSRPVRNVDQATGVIGGSVERSGPKAPRSRSPASVGSRPAASISVITS